MSEAQRRPRERKPFTAEHRQKLSEAKRGKPRSEETLRKIRETLWMKRAQEQPSGQAGARPLP